MSIEATVLVSLIAIALILSAAVVRCLFASAPIVPDAEYDEPPETTETRARKAGE